MKVYVVSIGISGEDYRLDEPLVLGIFKDLKSAKACMKSSYKDYHEDGECETTKQDMRIEETNSDADYHFVIIISEEEIE